MDSVGTFDFGFEAPTLYIGIDFFGPPIGKKSDSRVQSHSILARTDRHNRLIRSCTPSHLIRAPRYVSVAATTKLSLPPGEGRTLFENSK